jgi:hypothetical protein
MVIKNSIKIVAKPIVNQKVCELTSQLCMVGDCSTCFIRKQWDTVLGVSKDNRAEWLPE